MWWLGLPVLSLHKWVVQSRHCTSSSMVWWCSLSGTVHGSCDGITGSELVAVHVAVVACITGVNALPSCFHKVQYIVVPCRLHHTQQMLPVIWTLKGVEFFVSTCCVIDNPQLVYSQLCTTTSGPAKLSHVPGCYALSICLCITVCQV